MATLRSLLPKLTESMSKGDCGKIGVIGGSPEISGAPLNAALTAMKIGADLSFVYTHAAAALAISNENPELIVYPTRDFDTNRHSIEKLDALVFGPGLGRAEETVQLLHKVLDFAKCHPKICVVIDGDGLFYLKDCLGQLKECANNLVITPNHEEFARLFQAAFPGQQAAGQWEINGATAEAIRLASTLGVTVVRKGKQDVITNGNEQRTIVVDFKGTVRRCGGQGDILSGAIALFSYWAKLKKEQAPHQADYTRQHLLDGAMVASHLVRRASIKTFKLTNVGRCLKAADIIKRIPKLINEKDEISAYSRSTVPLIRWLLPLTDTMSKGDCGKIGVIGGSSENSAAPYFAAITPLRIGADLSVVYTHAAAAPTIKGYSPELIVYPTRDFETNRHSIEQHSIEKLDALVFGPGLERAEETDQLLHKVLDFAKCHPKVCVVIDADGQFKLEDFVAQLKECANNLVISMNSSEFARLFQALFPGRKAGFGGTLDLDDLSALLGVPLLLKRKFDVITDGRGMLREDFSKRAMRRCRGQGDILSGAIALFSVWAKLKEEQAPHQADYTRQHLLNGAMAASELVRRASLKTFEKFGRSMNAADIIEQIPSIINNEESGRNFCAIFRRR